MSEEKKKSFKVGETLTQGGVETPLPLREVVYTNPAPVYYEAPPKTLRQAPTRDLHKEDTSRDLEDAPATTEADDTGARPSVQDEDFDVSINPDSIELFGND